MVIKSNLKLFIVDDDGFCLNIYRQQLYNLGYTNIHTFSHRNECLNSIHLCPDAIFFDCNLDLESTIQYIKEMKSFAPHIYLIAISSKKENKFIHSILNAGAFDYIIKDNNTSEKFDYTLSNLTKNINLISKEI